MYKCFGGSLRSVASGILVNVRAIIFYITISDYFFSTVDDRDRGDSWKGVGGRLSE